MAALHAHHHRNPSHMKRTSQPHPRVSRPALPKRASKSPTTQVSSPRDAAAEDDPMATSFLNFCAVCEKQIIVPNNSILYCSEGCRKKDTTKPVTFEPSSPPTLNPCEDSSPSRDIIPPRSPTVNPAKRLSYSSSDASDDEAPERTLEKPRESEATRYLRVCTTQWPLQPHHHRRPSTSTTTSTTPSLSHTPTSSVSMSVSFTPSSRPLPRRNPHGSSYGTRSVDLVNPFTAAHPPTPPSSLNSWSFKSGPCCKTSTGIAEGELELFRKKIPTATGSGQGSLKQLFAFSAMQAPPSSTASTMRPCS